MKKITDAKIILGGPEVSFNPEDVLKTCSADACIIGEGEVTFSELIKNGLDFKNTDGVVFKEGDGIIKNYFRESSYTMKRQGDARIIVLIVCHQR